MRRPVRPVSIALLFTFALNAFSQTIIRGPYLQQPTPGSMIVRWRTDVPTNSKVTFGTDIGNLSFSATDTAVITEHSVKVTGLSPFTKYFYAVGSTAGVLGGPDAMQFFTTSPLPGTEQPIRLWVIGDFGKGSPEQKIVRDSYIQFAGDTHTDLWLWTGDNAYPDGTDEEFQTKVFDSITGYHKLFKYIPFMPTPGNHDYNSICPIICGKDPLRHKGPYYDIVDVPTEGEAGGVPSHTELYYSFDYGNVHFISLNSELGSLIRPFDYNGVFTQNFQSSVLTDWLRADLAATDKPWKIAFWHQTPYSGQDVDSDNFWEVYIHAMRDNMNPILESYGVDLVLTGHDHNYQRTYLLHGLYGNSNEIFDSTLHIVDGGSGNEATDGPYIKYTTGPEAGKGTVYVVQGNSGAGNPDGPITHPEMWGGDACGTCIGSFVVDINGNRLDGRYLKGNGEIGDHFTILKMEAPTAVIEHNSLQEKLKVFPNPTSGELSIEFFAAHSGEYRIDILDLTGKEMMNEKLKVAGSAMQSITLQMATFAPGTYIVQLKGGQETARVSVVRM